MKHHHCGWSVRLVGAQLSTRLLSFFFRVVSLFRSTDRCHLELSTAAQNRSPAKGWENLKQKVRRCVWLPLAGECCTRSTRVDPCVVLHGKGVRLIAYMRAHLQFTFGAIYYPRRLNDGLEWGKIWEAPEGRAVASSAREVRTLSRGVKTHAKDTSKMFDERFLLIFLASR